MQRFLFESSALRSAEEYKAEKNREYTYQLNNSRLVLSKNIGVNKLLVDISKYISETNVERLHIASTVIQIISTDGTSNEYPYQLYGLSNFPNEEMYYAISQQTILEYLLLVISVYEMVPNLCIVAKQGAGYDQDLIHIDSVAQTIGEWERLFSFEVYRESQYKKWMPQPTFSFGLILENGCYYVDRNRSFRVIHDAILTIPKPEPPKMSRLSWL